MSYRNTYKVVHFNMPILTMAPPATLQLPLSIYPHFISRIQMHHLTSPKLNHYTSITIPSLPPQSLTILPNPSIMIPPLLILPLLNCILNTLPSLPHSLINLFRNLRSPKRSSDIRLNAANDAKSEEAFVGCVVSRSEDGRDYGFLVFSVPPSFWARMR